MSQKILLIFPYYLDFLESQVSSVERIRLEPETRMVLENVAWETYVELADQRSGSIHRMSLYAVRMTLTIGMHCEPNWNHYLLSSSH